MENKKWYQKTGWIIVLLIFFFPVGLYLMWKYATWNKIVKIVVTAIIAILFLSNVFGNNKTQVTNNASTNTTNEAQSTASEPITEQPVQTSVPSTAQSSQNVASSNQTNASSSQSTAKSSADVPTEYKSALKKAKNYSDMMHMSKKGIYDQLTSEYGEKFSPEAAQYAIDNVQADWNKNALEKAKNYQSMMSMSPNAIYDQLVSEYGEKFTAEEARYAVDHLK